MNTKLYVLVALTVLCLLLPLGRFVNSPTFETARVVDLALVFGAGMAAGVLLTALNLRRRA